MKRIVCYLAVLSASFGALACGDTTTTNTPPLENGFGSALSEQLGCGDVSLYAADAADEILLRVRLPEMIGQAYGDAGHVYQTTFELPHPDVTVEVDLGTQVSQAACNDAVTGERVVDATLTATSGSIEVTITATNEEPGPVYDNPASADAVLEGVIVEGDGETHELGDVTLEAIHVGWLPG